MSFSTKAYLLKLFVFVVWPVVFGSGFVVVCAILARGNA